MLKAANLRFLRFSPNSFALRSYFNRGVTLPLSLTTDSRDSSFFTILCSSSPRQRSFNIIRRGNCSFGESDNNDRDDKGLPMDSNESVWFNKRKAEGMDKNDKRALQLKSRKPNPLSTLCYVQILGTGMDTQDTSPSVLLFFDKQRFIFNAGEGLQRFCTEHKIKLSKIDHIFLSRVCSETAGGLPGLLLTLSGIGEIGMSVKIWGPSDLNLLVNAMSSFIPKAAMVHTNSFGSLVGHDGVVVHDDEVVKISAILVRPLNVEAPLTSNSKAKPVKPSDISVIYVCELSEIKGKFDPEKAKALGLKPGPKFRQLQLGMSVKSDFEDIMVHSSDVLGPSIPGPIVLLVDCPTEHYMQELLSIQLLNSYYTNPSENVQVSHKNVHCVIHLTPMCIASTPDYVKWMKRFGGAQHIMAGHKIENAETPILNSSFRVSTRLNYLCPQFFPASGLCSHQSLNYLLPDHILPREETISEVCRVSCENLLKFHLRPYTHLGLDRSAIPASMTSSEILDELLSENPDITDAVHQVSQFFLSSKERNGVIPTLINGDMIEEPIPKCLESVSRKDIEVVFLGTGSSQPSKHRNVTSIFINLFSKGSLLFDCGEGTLGQLRRRFGVKGADDAVRALRIIWISHIHADHHTGLARILALRSNLLKEVHEPLLVIGPWPLRRYLDAYQRLEDLDMQFLDCRQTTKASLAVFESVCEQRRDTSENIDQRNSSDDTETTFFTDGGNPMESCWRNPIGAAVNPMLGKLKKILGDSGLEGLISFPVVHCPQAFGVVLNASERINCDGKMIPGWKLVYSGDTRPCPELIEASHGATLLIHEATFEEGMEEEAIEKNHSTVKEAIDVGTSAGAYRIILTHFSQRYTKVPIFDDKHIHNTCIAFDLMSINLADLHVLPKVVPFLKTLFKNEVEAEESGVAGDDVIGATRGEAVI